MNPFTKVRETNVTYSPFRLFTISATLVGSLCQGQQSTGDSRAPDATAGTQIANRQTTFSVRGHAPSYTQLIAAARAASYIATRLGLYDMGRNVWQWGEDRFSDKYDLRVLRGASWCDSHPDAMLSSFRNEGRASGSLHWSRSDPLRAGPLDLTVRRVKPRGALETKCVRFLRHRAEARRRTRAKRACGCLILPQAKPQQFIVAHTDTPPAPLVTPRCIQNVVPQPQAILFRDYLTHEVLKVPPFYEQ